MTTPASTAANGRGLALYRKYRSATFAELIGQEHVTRPLSTALDHGRINHAYLFSGPRGCGKTSSARILARSLNCAQGPTSTPCGVCDSCRELAPNGPGSIDVIEIDAASHNGVDDARDLRERAWYAPVRDRFKVYIVDEAHMVTTAAFNALLKLVEEPPDFLVFVFATTEPDKVLQTIRSRTHHYPFRLVPPSVLRGHLEAICAQEQVSVEPAVLPLVTRAGGGSVRDSLSILDQLLAGAGDSGLRYSDAVGLLGVTDAALIDTVVDALAASDAAAVFGAVDRVVEAGHDPRRFAADLLDRFRDLLILDAVPGAGESGLLDVPADVLERMADQVRRLGRGSVTRYAEITHQALVDMRGTTSPRLVLELVCARMLLPDAAQDAAAVLQRVEALERRASLTGPGSAPAPAPAPAPARAARPAPDADAGSPPRPSRRPPAAGSDRDEVAEPVAVTASSVGSDPSPPRPREQAPPSPSVDASTDAPTSTPAESSAATERPTESPNERPTESSTTTGSPSSTGSPAAAAGPAAPAFDSARVRQLWSDTVVRSIPSRRTQALLHDAQVVEVAGTVIRLSLPHAPLAKMLSEESNLGPIRTALQQALGGSWTVEVTVAGGGSAGPDVGGDGSAASPAGSGRARGWSADAADPASSSGGADGGGNGGSASPAVSRPRATGAQAAAEAPPEPPEPPDPRDDSEEPEPGAPAPRRVADPEDAAVDLLRSQLGARPVE